MTPQQYDQLKAVIQKAVPDIMELKFGCEVKFDKPYKKFTCVGKSEDYFAYWMDKDDDERCSFVVSERDGWVPKKILGRPIRLADCIYALTKSEAYEKDIHRFIWKWNFLDDNLDHQTDETKQFLFNLLIGG